MFNPRPSAWALVCVLVAGLLGSAPGPVAAAKAQCTGWNDDFRPPTEIRVLRRRGPNAGHVEVVPFWDYVGTVLRAEYSSGGSTGPIWMRIGALTVKQYGWYYAMHWRGGKVTFTDEVTGETTVECWDVKDTTADQIYKPERLVNGEWVPANVPTSANLKGMAETWHMTLRKFNVKKKSSRLFLTGYRSGKKKPCGADSTGFKIFQKSLRDCTRKELNFEETLRVYFESRLEIADARSHDIIEDPGVWLGDLGVLKQNVNTGGTEWRVYAPSGEAGAFGPALSGNLGVAWNSIIFNGTVDVDGDHLSDVVLLTDNGKLRVALANGNGYAGLTSQDLPPGTPTGAVIVGDFDGDLLGDVGLLKSTPVAPLAGDPATLVVMRGAGDGTFGAPVDWWRGALDLSPGAQQVLPGDVNGDGKTDLIIRDLSVGLRYWVAPSFASCADGFTVVGPCTLVPGTGLDSATVWFDDPTWSLTDTQFKQTPADYDRDGRTDLVLLIPNGTGVKLLGLKALKAGGFAAPQTIWQGANLAVNEVIVVGVDFNADALADIALLRKKGANTGLRWLRATVSAGVVTHSAVDELDDASLPWNGGAVRAY